MASIFLQLKEFQMRQEVLEKLTLSSTNEPLQQIIDEFYDCEDEQGYKDYAEFFMKMISAANSDEVKDKLFIAQSYFVSELEEQDAKKIIQTIIGSDQSVIQKVRFVSYLYKTINNKILKKFLLSKTVMLITTIQNSDKISSYANFIEHFDELTDGLDLNEEEALDMYSRLIGYLQKHLIYKKLCSVYVVKSLQKVTQKSAESQLTTSLILKAIQYGNISETALTLLNHKPLHKNKAYPIFQTLLTGDFQKLDMKEISQYENRGIMGKNILRKMKIESIPRLLGQIKTASYSQVADVLKIQKCDVESYIIQAIKEGILQAKLDEFEESIIINRVNFRALRKEERVELQRDITRLCDKLSKE